MKVAVKSLDNKKVGDISLDDSVFGVDVQTDILHRVVNWQLAKRRSGNHKVKTVSEISGTGKKPFRQKGTGNARLGNLRGTQQRGGQTVHGPVVRSHAFSLTKKVRQLGLKMALSAKQASGQLIVVDEIKSKTHKTKDMVSKLKDMGLSSALFVGNEDVDVNFARSMSNIPHVDFLPEKGANVYDILQHEVLVLTKDAVAKLEERLK